MGRVEEVKAKVKDFKENIIGHIHSFAIIRGSGENGTPQWKCKCGKIVNSN
jgi:hypothetical protein